MSVAETISDTIHLALPKGRMEKGVLALLADELVLRKDEAVAARRGRRRSAARLDGRHDTEGEVLREPPRGVALDAAREEGQERAARRVGDR